MEKHIQNWMKKLKQSNGINILQTVNSLHAKFSDTRITSCSAYVKHYNINMQGKDRKQKPSIVITLLTSYCTINIPDTY